MVGKKRILESLPLLNERELTLIWRDIRRAADVYAMDDNDKSWNDCLDLENAIENECEKRFGRRPASYKSLEGANELPCIYKKIYSIRRKRGESMAEIKFSHNYPKLHGQTSAKLIAVLPIRIDKNTPKELIEYDTKFDGGYFPLKTGNYIQLFFVGNLHIPFCTIRSSYPSSKQDYYKGKIGEDFKIVIKESEVK